MTANRRNFFTGEVSSVFGPHILQHTKDLCQGRFNYLEHLCDSLLLRIINYLELEDVARLGRASQRFRQVSTRHTCGVL